MKLAHILCHLASLFAITCSVRAESRADTAHAVPAGVSKTEWKSIRAAHDAWRHEIRKTENGWQAANLSQQWQLQFDGRGFVAEPTAGGWQWGLELKSYGFAGSERTLGSEAAVASEGQRLSYQWDAVLQEWYVNDQRGLEHGFTVSTRPPSSVPGDLAFTMGVRGGMRPVITADAQGVQFHNTQGSTVLTYAGLKVWDADGKVLPSKFAAVADGVRLLVDERGARYPLTIDPIAQQAYVKAGNSGTGDSFGAAVAIDGDLMAVGAPYEDGSGTGVNPPVDDSATDSGAVYVFERSGGTWVQRAYLKASNAEANDQFGNSVALSGNTLVVGAHYEDGGNAGVNPVDNNTKLEAGAAYVFVRTGDTWTQQAHLKASNPGATFAFGTSVGVSGDTIVVGSIWESSSTTVINSTPNGAAPQAGAAYVFVRNGVTWSQQAYLKPTNAYTQMEFGGAVAVSGDIVAVGAAKEDGSGTGFNPPSNLMSVNSGAAYVFSRSGAIWSQQAYLKASNTGNSDAFGISVALSGNTLAVGAGLEDGSGTGVNPASDDAMVDTGAAYVFVNTAGSWSQQAYIKASNPSSGDIFGSAIGISGDTLVVGAWTEDGSGTGIDPFNDDLRATSGAAYVFKRVGTTWTHKAYVKSSITDFDDSLGQAVAVSGDWAVIGAPLEDGSATGVNGAVTETAPGAGAVFLFDGLGLPEIAVAQGETDIPTGGSYDFGSVLLGSNTNRIFTITNSGEASLTLRGSPKVSLSGPDAASFSILQQPVSPVTALGGTTNFAVRFSPASTGTKQAALTILNDDADESPFQVLLSGTVAPAEIDVTQGAVSIPSGGNMDFGTVFVGASNDLTFTIANFGGENLVLSNIPKVLVTGPQAAMFSVVSQPSSPVAPASTTAFTVRFTPTSAGVKSAMLSIPNNDGNEGICQITITGTVPPQDIAVSQNSVNIPDGGSRSFGGAVAGSTADVTFTIANTGGVTLQLNGSPRVAITGAEASMFSIVTPPAATVPVGATTSFVVRFAPSSGGLKTAALVIPSNDADESPFDINISGAGLTYTGDIDGDGLSDASEAVYAAFGFDWQSAQPALVNTLFSGANGAGLYTSLQIQGLNVNQPLLTKDPVTGEFMVTLSLLKSTDLVNFTQFPMSAGQAAITGQGKLEYRFTVPGNAAFIRVQAQ